MKTFQRDTFVCKLVFIAYFICLICCSFMFFGIPVYMINLMCFIFLALYFFIHYLKRFSHNRAYTGKDTIRLTYIPYYGYFTIRRIKYFSCTV